MDVKKLIGKLLLGLLMVIFVSTLLRWFFDPSGYYGNDILDEKMKDYTAHADEYNTVFIGSSIFLRNVDPVLFDSLIPDSMGIRSYNLGSGGMLPPETYTFYEHLLKQQGKNIRYVFIELRDVGLFHPHNLHTLRKRYWMTPGSFAFITSVNLHSSLPASLRWKNILYYGISLFERMFVVNYFNDIFGQTPEDQETREYRIQQLRQANQRGYLSLEGRSLRQEQFLMDTSRVALMADRYRKFKADTSRLRCNSVHLRRILQIIDESEKRGIHVFFVLQPKESLVQQRETVGLAYRIPPENLINLGDPDLVPELYLARNSFSENHFNVSGTRILTRRMAERLIREIGKPGGAAANASGPGSRNAKKSR